VFAINTDNKDDLAYLDKLLKTHPKYSKHVAKKEHKGWIGSWEAVSVPNNVYIKIDDDVVGLTLCSNPLI
jgi:hypothetical protein